MSLCLLCFFFSSMTAGIQCKLYPLLAIRLCRYQIMCLCDYCTLFSSFDQLGSPVSCPPANHQTGCQIMCVPFLMKKRVVLIG